jgi:hypothetical protein
MHGEIVAFPVSFVSFFARSLCKLDAWLSTAAFGLRRHEDHQTRGRLADLLGSPAEHNIQQTTFTMTAQDQQIGFQVDRHLHNNVPGIEAPCARVAATSRAARAWAL